MREIKFRAWDNINKRMGYFAQGFEWNDEYNLWYLAYENGAEVSDVPCQENINLMQYTGLKDKNGKKIYEGDIVSVGNVAGIVEYEDEVAGFFAKVPSSEYFPFIASCKLNNRQIEVIGNIHENPELLKDETRKLEPKE